ncbi:hypothetical protein [Pseudoalteromonas sp. GB56]
MTTDNKPVYYYGKTRAQRALKFIAMATVSLLYIVILFGYEHYTGEQLPQDFRSECIWAFCISALVFFFVALWHIKHPAKFEAILTPQRLIVRYPSQDTWSFNVAVADIKRFEHRQSLSHAGKSIGQQGIVLIDGTFHHISMNYDLNINELFKHVRKIKADITYPKKVNTRVEGLLERDYKK